MGWQYSLDVLLSQFGTNLLFHVWFYLLLLDLHIGFSGQVRWSVNPISFRIFQLAVDPVKDFSVVNEAEVDVFLEFSCFFYDPMDVGNLISGSYAFLKSSLYIWKLSVHMLLKPSLKDFEHCLASMWDECNCAVEWTSFDIAPLWD